MTSPDAVPSSCNETAEFSTGCFKIGAKEDESPTVDSLSLRLGSCNSALHRLTSLVSELLDSINAPLSALDGTFTFRCKAEVDSKVDSIAREDKGTSIFDSSRTNQMQQKWFYKRIKCQD